MDAPDADKFSEAERLWESGDVQGALRVHLDLCINGRDDQQRLNSALLLVDQLKPVDSLPLLLRVCDVGIDCARKLTDPLPEAYLRGKKAENLAFLNGLNFVAESMKLRIAPGWFGFSLERDEKRFKELTEKIERNEAEVKELLTKALEIAERSGSHSTRAQILLSEGRVHINRYLHLKMEHLKQRFRVPAFLLSFLRPYRLDDFLQFRKDERARMNKCLEKCEASYLAAAEEYRRDGNEPASAYAYYNLANDLRTAFRFRRAKKYLRLAKGIAETHGLNDLLPGIGVLERSIQVRNRDIPNYVAGERREIPR